MVRYTVGKHKKTAIKSNNLFYAAKNVLFTNIIAECKIFIMNLLRANNNMYAYFPSIY